MMHSGTLLSKAEYSLMDRWFQFASEYYKKYVQPDVIGKQTYTFIHVRSVEVRKKCFLQKMVS